jgi:hypothetical protein
MRANEGTKGTNKNARKNYKKIFLAFHGDCNVI